jgi:hypothetical protein
MPLIQYCRSWCCYDQASTLAQLIDPRRSSLSRQTRAAKEEGEKKISNEKNTDKQND